MPPSDRPTRRPLLAAGAALCGALLAGGCATEPPARPGAAAHAAHAGEGPAGRAATVEELASALGCTAESITEADELRQAACAGGQGSYRLTTFAAEEGLRSWLAETRVYGGVYLVGNRWVVTAQSPQALTALRERLGGTLESGEEHTGH
ncbi:hypothetical protein [Streptomyces sp. C]|uniref:hypothetical protein n=1 Tax=Streptomyces sp. C TaxID=253839 RepID=UPI0001B5887D|nr:hypothetical protein [Streptomyces sp. C]EFL18846.1 predicted protein [Streptomyces sp. C]